MNSIWIEKYRPSNLDQIIGQDKNINTLDRMISNKSLPHLLFHGKSGTGKTSTILSIAIILFATTTFFSVVTLPVEF